MPYVMEQMQDIRVTIDPKFGPKQEGATKVLVNQRDYQHFLQWKAAQAARASSDKSSSDMDASRHKMGTAEGHTQT